MSYENVIVNFDPKNPNKNQNKTKQNKQTKKQRRRGRVLMNHILSL